MKRIKILCLDHYTKIGGGQRSLLTLLENLNKNIFYPIVAIPGKGDFYKELKRIGVNVKFIKLNAELVKIRYNSRRNRAGNPLALSLNFLSMFNSIISLYRLVKDEKIDLIYANTFKTALVGGIVGKLSGVPMIYHVRIFPNHGWLDNLATLLSTRIIANSKAVAKELHGTRRKIKVIYNAIDLVRFKPHVGGDRIRKEFKINKYEKVVGMVGRVTPEKDHKTFIKAAIKVISALPDTKFFVVGDAVSEEDEKYKRRIIQLIESKGLGDKFIFTGFRDDIPEIMASLDVLVIPSIKEPWGRVAAEAMAMGKPVIGTNAGGLREIIDHGKTGILVPPEDPDSLAEATITLLNDEELRKSMGKRGRREVKENFNIAIITGQMEKLFLQAVKCNR